MVLSYFQFFLFLFFVFFCVSIIPVSVQCYNWMGTLLIMGVVFSTRDQPFSGGDLVGTGVCVKSGLFIQLQFPPFWLIKEGFGEVLYSQQYDTSSSSSSSISSMAVVFTQQQLKDKNRSIVQVQ